VKCLRRFISVVTSPTNNDMSLADMRKSLASRAARIQEFSKSRGHAAPSDDASSSCATVAEAHEMLCKAGEALVQQARAFFFLMQDNPSEEHLAGVSRDLEKAIELYDSWVGSLLTAVLPVVRKSIGTPCANVLLVLDSLVAKAAAPGGANASDVGQLTHVVDALAKLLTSSAAATAQAVGENVRLISDATSELHESITESRAARATLGQQQVGDVEEEDEDDDEREEDVSELLMAEAIAGPLARFIAGAGASVKLAGDAAMLGRVSSDATLAMLITCAQASSNGVDATVCATYEDDAPSVAAHATSLMKVLRKLHQLLRERCGIDAASELGEKLVALEGALEAECTALGTACTDWTPDDKLGALSLG
jgi:hypothetical protein